MATRGEVWSREEDEATVADYFNMLAAELAGQQYSKAEHRRRLQVVLNNRSEGAIEQKHMNISAVLREMNFPWIAGYKPLPNYQALLLNVVEERLKDGSVVDRAALAATEMPAVTPLMEDFSGVVEDPPHLALRAEQMPPRNREKRSPVLQRDYLSREARNSSLGFAGEEFVLGFEHWRLAVNGKGKLADRIEHVSKTKGDGLGYDILSYELNGQERLIEVKTTAFAKETPFFVTRTESDVSREEADSYHLLRVFEFRKSPKLFSLRGAIESHCYLDPVTYRATFG